VIRDWRKQHNEDLRNLHSSPSIMYNDEVKEDMIGRDFSTNGGEGKCI
jgi:hypothetical protein